MLASWRVGLSVWLAVNAAVGLTMLLMELAVGKCLILNCVFNTGLNKNATTELIACTV